MSSILYQDNPCRDCVPPKRHIGCHGNCPDHKEWKAAVEGRKTRWQEEQSSQRALDNIEKIRTKRRMKNRRSSR